MVGIYPGLSIKRIPLREGHNCLVFCFQVVLSQRETLINQLSPGIDFGRFSRSRQEKGFGFLEELSILDQRTNFVCCSILLRMEQVLRGELIERFN